jgi:hypothetical protein
MIDMTDEQWDRAYALCDMLQKEVKAAVNDKLKSEDADVEEFVRQKLTEDIRFWKGW